MAQPSTRNVRVLICTLFNLCFEYSLRGVGGFRHDLLLAPVLFVLYFAYFSMLDDLIRRHRLHNYELLLLAFLYELLIATFASGTIFDHGAPLGLNWGALFFEGVLWWGILQGLLTFYLAGRLAPRDWSAPPMGPLGWTLCLLYTALFLAVAARNPLLHHGTPAADLAVAVLGLGVLLILAASLRRPHPAPWIFRGAPVLDALVAISIVLFLITGSLPARRLVVAAAAYINPTAATIVYIWTLLFSAAYLLYRWIGGREVTL